MSKKDLKENITEAYEITKELPEHIQGIAFSRAFDVLMEIDTSTEKVAPIKSKKKMQKKGTESTKRQAEQVINEKIINIDRKKHPELSTKNKVLDNALWLLRIARDEYNVKRLSVSQIAKEISETFLMPATPQMVKGALNRAGNKVLVSESESGKVFQISAHGQEYLDLPQEEQKKLRTSKKVNSSDRNKTSTKKKTKKVKNNSSKQTSGKPGPKPAILGLLTDGFFDSPKTNSDIQAHLKKNTGYVYESKQLSTALVRLLRVNAIDREKNNEGQWAYKPIESTT